jgi:hypothetical protein
MRYIPGKPIMGKDTRLFIFPANVRPMRDAITVQRIAAGTIRAGMMVAIDGNGHYREARHGDVITGVALTGGERGQPVMAQTDGTIDVGYGTTMLQTVVNQRQIL